MKQAKQMMRNIRNWLLKRLSGSSVVMINAHVKGMGIVGGEGAFVHESLFDATPNLTDGDPYEWFTPCRPVPYALYFSNGKNCLVQASVINS